MIDRLCTATKLKFGYAPTTAVTGKVTHVLKLFAWVLATVVALLSVFTMHETPLYAASFVLALLALVIFATITPSIRGKPFMEKVRNVTSIKTPFFERGAQIPGQHLVKRKKRKVDQRNDPSFACSVAGLFAALFNPPKAEFTVS